MAGSREHSPSEATSGAPASPIVPPVSSVPPLDPEILARAYQALQAMGQPAQSDVPQTSRTSGRWTFLSAQIIRRCPKEFVGNEGAVAAQEWLREIKRHLEVLDCTPYEEVRLAAYRLTGKARSWWDAYVRTVGKEHIEGMTWEDFCDIFEQKYVPEYAKLQLMEEYEELTQGSMSVEDYYQKFDDLSYYSPHETERRRVERFKRGLNPSLQDKVGHMRFYTLSQAVETASMAERVIYQLQREDDNKGKKKDAQGSRSSRFNGRCRKCGKHGHKYVDCRSS